MPSATYPIPTSVQIDGLGELSGWLNADGSQQFFNIPYAQVSKRFTHSKLKTSWSDTDGKREGRYLGAACAQPSRPFYPFLLPVREHLKYADTELMDEFDCLNLHITVPPGVSLNDKIPILFFIHGGGFVFGTANYSLVDGRKLACLSAELGKPTIIVTCNYRLGFYGFLASHDIGAEADGPNGNFGLIDQKNALLWVNKYISSFGGDNGRVLLTGQSAGGISVDAHMRSPWNHLFQTAVLQSGTIPICGMYTVDEYDVIYRKLLHQVGIDTALPGPERLEALRRVPHEVVSQATYEVFQGLNLPQFGVTIDDNFYGEGRGLPLPAAYTDMDLSETFPGRVILGDCMHEGIIYDQAYRDHPVSKIRELIHKHLPEPLAGDFVAHYDLRDDMTYMEKYRAVEAMTTDGIFGASPYYLAERNPDKTYVYHWDHLSQFDNPWGGFAHHSLDYMWLFGNVAGIITPKERELSRVVATDYITFAHGLEPYPAYGADKISRIYGPLGGWSVAGKEYAGRPMEWFEHIKPYLTEVDKLCTDLMMRRPELVSPEYGPGSSRRVKVTQGKPLAL